MGPHAGDMTGRGSDQRGPALIGQDSELPASVVMTVIETQPAVKGDTKTNTMKAAKVDTGVEIHIKPGATDADPQLERGYDDKKGMKFVKVFYNKDLGRV